MNKYLLDSRSSHHSFDSFCEKKPNKYNTTASFGAAKGQRLSLNIDVDDNKEINRLVNAICKELEIHIEKNSVERTLKSPWEVFSPKGNTNYNSNYSTKPFALESPKCPQASNKTFTSSFPKFSSISAGYCNLTSKLKGNPQPTSILEKLKRQRADFDEFKTKFGY